MDKIQALKNTKAAGGPDGILNEVLKNTEHRLRLDLHDSDDPEAAEAANNSQHQEKYPSTQFRSTQL